MWALKENFKNEGGYVAMRFNGITVGMADLSRLSYACGRFISMEPPAGEPVCAVPLADYRPDIGSKATSR